MVLSLSGLMTIRNILAYSSIVKKNPDNNSCTTANSFALVDLVQSTSKILPFSIANSVWSGQEMWVLITPVSMHTNKSTFNPPQQMWYRKFVFLIIEWRFWQFCINIFLWRVNQRFKLLFVYKSELVMMLTSKFDVNGNTIVCRWNEISWKF